MDLETDFTFRPIPELDHPIHMPEDGVPNPLGYLRHLPGHWAGTGFNTIWRPFFDGPDTHVDEFLELNLTQETLDVTAINGPIPNRGFFQPDINMFGLTYMQQINDTNNVVNGVHAGLHIEPGIWATVPRTSSPQERPTVVRMASIPHGTTILAQGMGERVHAPSNDPLADALIFPDNDIDPIVHGVRKRFDQQNLSMPTPRRTPDALLTNITQAMVDNPNSVLRQAIVGQQIVAQTVLRVDTMADRRLPGGGTSNTAFLMGGPAGPNARTTDVRATFCIEWVKAADGQPGFRQLRYSQLVILVFDDGILWPHVTVGILRQTAARQLNLHAIDPEAPAELIQRMQVAQRNDETG